MIFDFDELTFKLTVKRGEVCSEEETHLSIDQEEEMFSFSSNMQLCKCVRVCLHYQMLTVIYEYTCCKNFVGNNFVG